MQDRGQAGINAPLGATPLGEKISEHAILIREEGNTDPMQDEERLGQAHPITPQFDLIVRCRMSATTPRGGYIVHSRMGMTKACKYALYCPRRAGGR